MSQPATTYLDLTRQTRRKIARMFRLIELGEKMSQPLLAGGGLFTPQIGTYWPRSSAGRPAG